MRFVDVEGLHRSFLTYGSCDPKKYVELAESYADRIPKEELITSLGSSVDRAGQRKIGGNVMALPLRGSGPSPR